jgi:outer membrane receptor for ferrienterochelin and colicins
MVKYSVLAVFAMACAMAGWDATAVEDAARSSAGASTELAGLSLEELMNVEISVASKRPETTFEAPGVVVVVPREEIELYGDRTLFELMQRQPSIYTRDYFFAASNVAAFRGDMSSPLDTHTLVLLNGRPVRESAHAINVPVYIAFPLASLGSVELIRGPGSVLYGTNAFTGVINLRTRPVPEQREISVSAMGGSYGYYDTTVTGGGTFGEVGFVGSLRVAGQDGWPYRMTDAQGVYGEDDARRQSVAGAAHVAYRGFTLDVFGADMEAFVLGVQPLWCDAEQDLRVKRLFVNAGYRAPLHERARLEFNLTYNLQENDRFSPFTPRVGTNTSDVLGEVTLFANPTDNLNVVVGYVQEYRSNYTPDQDLFQSIPAYEYWPRSAYLQGDYTIGDTAKLIAGTQWNESPQGDSDLISRLGVIVTPATNWGVKLLRGEAFRGAIAAETDVQDPPTLVGNPDLKPETVTTYDAQLFYHDEKTYAAVTYFHSDLDQQILVDKSTSDPTMLINGGRQRFRGVEIEAKRFLTPHWHVLGSFMRYDYEADPGLDQTVVPDQMLKVGTAYTWDWGSAAVFCTHFGEPPTVESPLVVNPEPEAMDLVSLNVRFDVSEWLGLDKGQSFVTLRGENLLDEDVYAPTLGFIGVPNSFPYGAGRTLYLGVEVNF